MNDATPVQVRRSDDKHLNFASDNAGPVHPKVMSAVMEANSSHAMPYGADDWTARAVDLIRQVFDAPEAEVVIVPTGTAANAVALSTLVEPWQRVYCSDVAHIEVDELGALGFYNGGAATGLVAETHAKLAPDALSTRLSDPVDSAAQRGAFSLANLTERGTLYRPDEVCALSAVAAQFGLPVHMDGARFANAIAASGAKPAEMTWQAGVQALSFGGTKNGLMGVEAIVFFGEAAERYRDEARLRRQRAGLTFSKHRYLAAQLVAYLTDGLWLEMAAASNSAATHLAEGLAERQITLLHPVDGNMIFASVLRRQYDGLRDGGARFYLERGNETGAPDDVLEIRLVCDWTADTDRNDRFLAVLDRERAYR